MFDFDDCSSCGRPDCAQFCICYACGDGPNAHDEDCTLIPRDRFGRLACEVVVDGAGRVTPRSLIG